MQENTPTESYKEIEKLCQINKYLEKLNLQSNVKSYEFEYNGAHNFLYIDLDFPEIYSLEIYISSCVANDDLPKLVLTNDVGTELTHIDLTHFNTKEELIQFMTLHDQGEDI